MQVKAPVARCYIRDGNDLLELFRLGRESDRKNRSCRSKLFINLRTAIECYLKGLVIVYSTSAERPEDAYKAVRTRSHRLAGLLTEIPSGSKWTKRYFRKASDTSIAQVDAMKVDLRYEINLIAEFSKETFEDQIDFSGRMSGIINSGVWMMSLFEHAKHLGKKADKAFARKLRDH